MQQTYGGQDEDTDEADHTGHGVRDGDVLQALLQVQIEELADNPETGVGHMVENQGTGSDGQSGGDRLQAQQIHHGSHNANGGHAGGRHGTHGRSS